MSSEHQSAVPPQLAGTVIRGRVTPPPSKSLTHRFVNLALLSGRPAVLERPLVAEDTDLFLGALEALGWRIARGADAVRLEPPVPPSRPRAQRVELDCGNAGTMYRFLAAALTVLPGRFRLDGTARLRERPVGPLLRALRSLGGRVECPEREGYAPIDIEGGSLTGGRARVEAGESSQYLSALLMAGLRARSEVVLEVAGLTSAPYVALTRGAIRRSVEGEDPIRQGADGGPGTTRIAPVPSGRFPGPGRVAVEPDLSAACYPAAGAALTGGAVVLESVRRDSLQGDLGFLRLLGRMGARLVWREDGAEVRGTPELVSPGVADLSSMPDQVPTLAALAPFARGTTRIENVAHLRIKESDRLRAMAEGLGRLGVPVEERPDGLVIPGVWSGERGGGGHVVPGDEVVIETFDDHRIAMSFALVALRREGVVIDRPGVVAKSYPRFWQDLGSLLTTP